MGWHPRGNALVGFVLDIDFYDRGGGRVDYGATHSEELSTAHFGRFLVPQTLRPSNSSGGAQVDCRGSGGVDHFEKNGSEISDVFRLSV